MSYRYLFLLLTVISFFFTTTARSQPGQPITDFQQIKARVDSNRFEMIYTIATTHYSYFQEPGIPYSDQNVRIANDSAFIIIRDSVAAGYLPYFGSGYSIPRTGTNGVLFSNKMINPTSETKGQGKRQSINYEFSVIGVNDSYRIRIIIQQYGICYLYINSTKRSPISYIGQVVEKVD